MGVTLHRGRRECRWGFTRSTVVGQICGGVRGIGDRGAGRQAEMPLDVQGTLARGKHTGQNFRSCVAAVSIMQAGGKRSKLQLVVMYGRAEADRNMPAQGLWQC